MADKQYPPDYASQTYGAAPGVAAVAPAAPVTSTKASRNIITPVYGMHSVCGDVVMYSLGLQVIIYGTVSHFPVFLSMVYVLVFFVCVENYQLEVQSTYQASGNFDPVNGCSQCGLVGHQAKWCPETKKCRTCGKTGHQPRDCPNAGRVRLAEDENDTIYVSGLPSTITEEKLKNHFGSIGLIKVLTSSFLPLDRSSWFDLAFASTYFYVTNAFCCCAGSKGQADT